MRLDDEFGPVTLQDRLLARLGDPEDSFVERKTKLDGDELREAAVAFANTVTAPNTGVFFAGVEPGGNVVGIEGDPDKALRKAARHLERCYPPIPHEIHALRTPTGASVLAVVVSESVDRPHFAGGAYVRRGSSTVTATEKVFQELVEDRLSQVRWLRPFVGHQVSLIRDRGMIGLDSSPHFMRTDAMLKEVNQFYIWLAEGPARSDGSMREDTFSLGRVIIEYDVERKQPRLRIAPSFGP